MRPACSSGPGYLKVALDIDKRLAAADPNNTSLTRKLFVTCALLGQLVREGPGHTLATPAEVFGYLQGAVEVTDKLAAADPGNRQYLRDIITASEGLAAAQGLNSAGNEGLLLQAWQRLAVGLTDSGQYEEALAALAKAEQYATEAEKRNPGVALNIVNRSQILRTRAEVYMGRKRWIDAIENIQSTITTYAGQARRDPGNQVYVNEQPSLYAMLADCLAASGQRAAAVTAMQDAIGGFRDIEARCPLVPEEEKVRRGHLAKLAALQSSGH